ncbi:MULTISPECIES: 5-dehydro-4-deoxyglucarate dehydratase [unclassified Streptomyces]|uniref:5-dehydro-4-deoxyglucarate dehydratase n=1 Tax=unclassified Streptomyces TaxID=2593676 RepID=UPI0029B2811B|nr:MULTISPECIES: 5-dehydro-4-deoxyglucarate dehydratase [unclassified Streptomyces]MDX3772382.1 5-dehydro-4-deoxyglucarate dehydratase [Streptomyces sp. AK08-01B]MDX3821880.1 5-dehydro-4-deoxyglucarate dehydratase [Streptomyces sp. AK08-01A]
MLEGVLFFPVTPFTPDGSVDVAKLAEHVRSGVRAGAGGVVVACGTGEFHALAVEEFASVVRTAVEVTDGRVPVFAGAGGSLPLARQYARAADEAGADGLLLMPPYLVAGPPAGLVAYVRQVVKASSLPVIVYQRGTARFDVPSALEVARLPQVVGLKDGTGDLDLLARIVTAIRADTASGGSAFQFFNGMPTAEGTVLAYRGIGVELYSSAVLCFAPEIALAFHRAVTAGDEVTVQRLLGGFFHPLITLREKVPGYSVALVKAAVRQGGLDVGGVRPPLTDPAPEDLAELERITAQGRALVAANGVGVAPVVRALVAAAAGFQADAAGVL